MKADDIIIISGITLAILLAILAIFMFGRLIGQTAVCDYIKSEHDMTNVVIPEFTSEYCSAFVVM